MPFQMRFARQAHGNAIGKEPVTIAALMKADTLDPLERRDSGRSALGQLSWLSVTASWVVFAFVTVPLDAALGVNSCYFLIPILPADAAASERDNGSSKNRKSGLRARSILVHPT